MDLISIYRKLSRKVDQLEFSAPVSCVYNPLRYAKEPFENYLTRYGSGPKEIVMLGMNPGPFGMVQTGVPFGDVSMVKDWMGIKGRIMVPEKTHPKRPIEGFSCQRSEVSGSRLWGWAKDNFKTPKKFFMRFFVLNYCPLCFLEESGRNRTPDKLPKAEKQQLLLFCDQALIEAVQVLNPKMVIGIGAFACKQAQTTLKDLDIPVGQVLHPSPASPKANKGWKRQASEELRQLGIEIHH